jgi:hypothetical protein
VESIQRFLKNWIKKVLKKSLKGQKKVQKSMVNGATNILFIFTIFEILTQGKNG